MAEPIDECATTELAIGLAGPDRTNEVKTGIGIWPGAPCDAPLEYANDAPLTLRPAGALKGTGVLPVLDAPLDSGQNLVYCTVFQIAWDPLRDTLAVDALQFSEARLLATKLNAARFPRDALSHDCYMAVAGRSTDDIRNRFVTARQEKFPNATLPTPHCAGFSEQRRGYVSRRANGNRTGGPRR